MWLRGSKNGVSRWYVCWGVKGVSYNVELYQTLNGLVKSLLTNAYSELPIHRIGRMVITEEGPVETHFWPSREQFLKWAESLQPYIKGKL